MSEYRAPVKEMRFVINELAGLATVASLPGFAEAALFALHLLRPGVVLAGNGLLGFLVRDNHIHPDPCAVASSYLFCFVGFLAVGDKCVQRTLLPHLGRHDPQDVTRRYRGFGEERFLTFDERVFRFEMGRAPHVGVENNCFGRRIRNARTDDVIFVAFEKSD